MHHRVRYRLTFPPFAVVTLCVAAFVAMQWGPLGPILEGASHTLPRLITAVALVVPIAFVGWYVFSYADVRRQTLTVRSTFSARRIDVGTLVAAEVFAKPSGGALGFLRGGIVGTRQELELMLRLEDEQGAQLLLPLNTWHDEDLLMARVLRATVDRRVRIEGEPLLVRRFSGLLETYKSWDRRQKSAA